MLNITVQKKDILSVLSGVQGILEKKPTMDILQNVFIYTYENKLFIEATDLEITYKGSISCNLTEDGALLVNGKILFGLIRTLNFDEINILEEENLRIKILSKDMKNSYKLSALSHENFPKLKTVNLENSFEIQSELFLEMIEKVIGVTSSDPLKIALSGILFVKETKESVENVGNKKEIIRLVSSDGHRLNLIEREIDPTNIADFEIIIPKKGVNELRKLIEKTKSFRFGIDEKNCFIYNDNNFLLIRLIDDRYPNYKKIIPSEFFDKIIINRLYLIDTLNRISILSSAGSFQGFRLETSGDVIKLKSLENQIGEISEEIPATFNKDRFIMALNENYLLSVLNIIKSENINLLINDKDSPCMITSDDDPGFLGLIMPMNLDEEEYEA